MRESIRWYPGATIRVPKNAFVINYDSTGHREIVPRKWVRVDFHAKIEPGKGQPSGHFFGPLAQRTAMAIINQKCSLARLRECS